MKTLQHFFYPGILSLLFLISMIGIEGCAKNNGDINNTTTSLLLDSVISDNGGWPYVSIRYIYDSQERVIEERVSHKDTLKCRRTYQYQSSNMLPYKMISYKGTNTSPQFVSDFLYNANGQKIYDSTYAMPGSSFTGSMGVTLNYSVAGKITIKQEQHPSYNYYYDTIFLNNGNIDSAQTLFNSKAIFTQYTNKVNVLKSLSISSCRFYSPTPSHPGQMYTGAFASIAEEIPLEYFSMNDYGVATGIWTSPASPSVTQFDYQYNSSNLPVTLKKTTTYALPGYGSVSQTRFVYK